MKFLALIFIVLNVFALNTMAAPTPLGSSSIILQKYPNIYLSPLGFQIHTAQTDWTAINAQMKSEFIVAAFTKDTEDSDVRAAFTVRVDKLKKPITTEQYAKKWLKDYPRLGFEVLTSKKVSINGQIGFLLDLVNRDNKMQLRQLLFVKNRHVVNLTCRDQMKDFTQSLQDCNKIFRNFNWK